MTSRKTELKEPVPYVSLEGLEGKPLYDLTIAIKTVALDGKSGQARLGVKGPEKVLSSFRGLEIPLKETGSDDKIQVLVEFVKEWPKDVSIMLMLGPGDKNWVLARALTYEGKIDESRLEDLKYLASLYGLPLKRLDYLKIQGDESQIAEKVDIENLGNEPEIVVSDPNAYILIPAISDKAERFYKDIYGENKKRNILASLFASGAFKPLPPQHRNFIEPVGALELSGKTAKWLFLEEKNQKEFTADLKYVLGV